MGTDLFSLLVQAGYRRSGLHVYRPQCDVCNACTSIRLPANELAPDRSQRRAWRQHQNLQVKAIKPVFLDEHYQLYVRYQRTRHCGGGMDSDDITQFQDFLVSSGVETWMIEFRQPSPINATGDLVMVSIVDRVNDGLSAVYTFYESQSRQSYGTYSILWLAQLVQRLGLSYLYLGYWIQDSQKMAYKARFKPHELLIGGHWQPGTDFTK